MNPVNPTAFPTLPLARSAIDRAAHRRTDDLLQVLLADSATRVLAVSDGRSPVTGDPVGSNDGIGDGTYAFSALPPGGVKIG